MSQTSSRIYEGVARRARKASASLEATAALRSVADHGRNPLPTLRTFRDLQRARDGQTVDVDGLSIAYRNGAQFRRLVREILVERCYQPLIDIGPCPIIVDVGANIGVATMYFLSTWSGAKVLAFEPDPDSFRCLETNISANGLENATAHNIGLGRSNGSATLHTSSGAGSLRASLLPSRGGEDEVDISVRRLSDFIAELDRVDYLKIDVEGSEVGIIRDLDESGAIDKVRYIAVEFHHNIPEADMTFGQFLEVLDRHGFVCQIDADRKTSPENVQDILVHAARRSIAD